MSKMTKEQFIGQFPYKANVEKIKDSLIREHHPIENWYKGIEIYRSFNLLLIKVDGQFYCHE